MRKLVVLGLLVSLIWSCSVDEGSEENYRFEILPIANVEVPESLEGGNLNRVNYSYLMPTNCHGFNNLYYIENGNQRTIAVVNTVTESAGITCQVIDELDERSFDIYAPPGFSSLVLNFWQGENEDGEDVYLSIEVPVAQ